MTPIAKRNNLSENSLVGFQVSMFTPCPSRSRALHVESYSWCTNLPAHSHQTQGSCSVWNCSCDINKTESQCPTSSRDLRIERVPALHGLFMVSLFFMLTTLCSAVFLSNLSVSAWCPSFNFVFVFGTLWFFISSVMDPSHCCNFLLSIHSEIGNGNPGTS